MVSPLNPISRRIPGREIGLAKAVQLQAESIGAHVVEQGGFQAAADHRADYVLSLFLGRQDKAR